MKNYCNTHKVPFTKCDCSPWCEACQSFHIYCTTKEQIQGLLCQAPKSIASDIKGHLDDACGQLGHDMAEHQFDDKDKRKVARLKKNGVTDIAGRLADDFYNDTGLLADLAGDKLCDQTDGHPAMRDAVLDELAKGAHPAMQRACKQLRRDK